MPKRCPASSDRPRTKYRSCCCTYGRSVGETGRGSHAVRSPRCRYAGWLDLNSIRSHRRKANIEDLGLEAANVHVGSNGVEVDEYLRTSNPNVYAAGDVAFLPAHRSGLRQHAQNRTDRLGANGRVPWQARLASPLSRGGRDRRSKDRPLRAAYARTADVETAAPHRKGRSTNYEERRIT